MWKQMARESVFKKIIIASNFDGGYSQSAIENAKLLLNSDEVDSELDLKKLWAEETAEIQRLAKLCNICRAEHIAYTEDIYFCTAEIKDIENNSELEIPDFIPEIISDKKIGIVRTVKNRGFLYASGSFRLCSECLESHPGNKSGILQINMKEYLEHPMYKYYEALGFNRIKQRLE